jgi:hypothetical protein
MRGAIHPECATHLSLIFLTPLLNFGDKLYKPLTRDTGKITTANYQVLAAECGSGNAAES